MRAIILSENGLQAETVPDPVADASMALVDLTFAGLNRRDYWISVGKYPGIVLPAILGSDGVGIVRSGPDHLVGQRVVIDPSLFWGLNEDAQGPEFSILGMPTQGTLAERIAVPAANVHLAPSHCSDEECAALPLAGVTAYRATVRQGRVAPGCTVLVTGIGGGVASFAARFAAAMGASVWVTSGKADVLHHALDEGIAHGGCLYTDADWPSVLKKQSGGFDCIIDSAGGPTVNSLLDCARPGARIVFYGATLGAVPSLNLHRVFWKQLHIVGCTMGSPSDFASMLDVVSLHRIHPYVDGGWTFDSIGDAFQRLASSEQRGNIVVRCR